MRIVIAPDKFKGSLEADQVAQRLAAGIRAVSPSYAVDCVPVADGGEGTVDAALASGWQRVDAQVTGPAGRPVDAHFAIRQDGDTREALVEMAMASGLGVLPTGPDGRPALDALGSTSRGTGELILAALDAGCSVITLGVGGSANTDGGSGLMEALGVRLLDDAGAPVPPGGGGLASLSRVDVSGLDPRVARTRFVLASDVDNPLTGSRGAAAVFGPQKGASEQDVTTLDTNLGILRDRLADALGDKAVTGASAAGAGAAGGVGYAALVVLDAQRRPGIEVVLDLVGLEATVAGADLVITGEGSLDEQSLGGKTPMGVAQVAQRQGVPVTAVCGRTTLDRDTLRNAGFGAVWPLTDVAADLQECIEQAGTLLEQQIAPLVVEWLTSQGV